MDKEYIIDSNVMGLHLANMQTHLTRALDYNNTIAVSKADKRTKAFMVRDSLKRMKEQIAMAELYIAAEREDS
jgi:hypothetical protein